MGNDFDLDDIPKNLAEVAEKQRKIDTVRISNTLEWIGKMRKTPPEKLSKDDITDIQQLSYYVNGIYEYDDCRPKELKRYPCIDQDMRTYLREQSTHYYRLLKKSKAKNKQLKVAKVSTFVACISMIIMFTAQGVSMSAFGYDLLGNIGDWGKTVLGISHDVVISQDNITLVRNGKTSTYKNISEAINDLGINILYPTYLPDGVYIDNIIYIDKNSNITVHFKFNDINYEIYITLNTDDDIILPDHKTVIGSRECQINQRDDFYQADFIEESYFYSIKSKNYDELIKIIENLKYD